MNVANITSDECMDRYPELEITDSLGVDKGCLFNTLAIRCDRYNGVKVVEYLPCPGSGSKNNIDLYVVTTDV